MAFDAKDSTCVAVTYGLDFPNLIMQLTHEAKHFAFEFTRQPAASQASGLHHVGFQTLHSTGMPTFPLNASGSFVGSRWHHFKKNP